MKTILLFTMLMISFNALSSSKIVVKLGSDTRSFKSNLVKLQKELKVIDRKLLKIENLLVIPSHIAGEISNLDKALSNVTKVSTISKMVPPVKSAAKNLRAEIEEIESSVKEAKKVTDKVSVLIVPIRKEVKMTRKKVGKISRWVKTLRTKKIPSFYEAITSSQDCVYKAKTSKRSCMQDELDSVADDMEPLIEDANQEVIALLLAVDKVKGKIAELQKVLNEITHITKGVQKLEYYLHKLIVPFLDLRKLMEKDFTTKFSYPNPYNVSKHKVFYVKLSGQQTIIGVHHIMNEIKKMLRGALLKSANKYGVKKMAKQLSKGLDTPLKKVLKKMQLKINFNIKGLSKLHKLDDSLMDPLGELRSMMKDIKLEVKEPKAISCKTLSKECS